MNHRIWDLAYVDRGPLPQVADILCRLNDMGYRTRPMSETEFDSLYGGLPPDWRFCNKTLAMAGVENGFLPKPEYKDRIVWSQSRLRN